MSVAGLGCDLHNMSRMRSLVSRHWGTSKMMKWQNKILHPKEIMVAKTIKTQDELVKYLSVRWCVKEALYKSLDLNRQSNFSMVNWCKSNDEAGQPVICGDQLLPNEKFMLTLSHDGDLVMAVVLRSINII